MVYGKHSWGFMGIHGTHKIRPLEPWEVLPRFPHYRHVPREAPSRTFSCYTYCTVTCQLGTCVYKWGTAFRSPVMQRNSCNRHIMLFCPESGLSLQAQGGEPLWEFPSLHLPMCALGIPLQVDSQGMHFILLCPESVCNLQAQSGGTLWACRCMLQVGMWRRYIWASRIPWKLPCPRMEHGTGGHCPTGSGSWCPGSGKLLSIFVFSHNA